MTKTYLLEEAKELVKNGTHQVHNDCDEKIDILRKTLNSEVNGKDKYYKFKDSSNIIFDKEIIPLSAIEDIRWGDEVQGGDHGNSWSDSVTYVGINPNSPDCPYVVSYKNGVLERYKYIRKPVLNFSALIQSAQEEADKIQKGYVVKIEKL